MPPKAKFTREEIVSAGLELVRRGGWEALTARALGAALGSSPRPIFTVFTGMEEVSEAVMEAAGGIYQQMLEAEMARGVYPPYKASGMGYIRFAREERELFRLLFMRDRSREKIGEDRESIRPLLELIEGNLGVDEDAAYLFHLEMWIVVHGIATMFATAYLDLGEGFVSDVLTDAYEGLCTRWRQKQENGGMEGGERGGSNQNGGAP